MNYSGIGWWNTGFPLALLAGLAVVLPVATVPRGTRSHVRLAGGIALSAGGLLIASAVLFALLHVGTGNALRLEAVGGPAALSVLVWAPLLGLVWFARAQGVERRRGADRARNRPPAGTKENTP